MRILLVGYYGRGNFGDDLLLKITHAILRRAMPHAAISVIVDGSSGDYISTLLGESVTILPPGRHGKFDLIVHGGGGVFFDFAHHRLKDRLIEKFIEAIGYESYLGMEKLLRIITGRQRTSARSRIGLGIGVGTFTPGSPALRDKLATLADFDALWVRDAVSLHHLKRFDNILSAQIIEGSDLAFLTEYWPVPAGEKPNTPRPRLGVILRDWPRGLSEAQLSNALANLAREYEITGFVFDAKADPETAKIFTPYRNITWRPEKMSIESFSQELAAQDVLLTSRAHGAICGACLGVPSVIIAIEPKLEQVAAMLPNSCHVVNANSTENWSAVLQHARSITRETLLADVEKNRSLSLAALQQIGSYIA